MSLPVRARCRQGQGRQRRLYSPSQGCYERSSEDRDAAYELRGGLEYNNGHLLIDIADTEEIKQAIHDEPRRRMDEAPGKRATEQDRHPNATTSASVQQEEGKNEQCNKRPRLNDEETRAVAEEEKSKVAEEDEDSEPSSDEDDD